MGWMTGVSGIDVGGGTECLLLAKGLDSSSIGVWGGVWGVNPPPPEIPKALQNHAKLNPTVKTVKIAEFRTPTPQNVRKKGSKISKTTAGSKLFYTSSDK